MHAWVGKERGSLSERTVTTDLQGSQDDQGEGTRLYNLASSPSVRWINGSSLNNSSE